MFLYNVTEFQCSYVCLKDIFLNFKETNYLFYIIRMLGVSFSNTKKRKKKKKLVQMNFGSHFWTNMILLPKNLFRIVKYKMYYYIMNALLHIYLN